jgi:ATP-dependent DNA helicase RecQ
MAKEGLCLVISPLIALMEDQVNRLRENNMTAAALTSGMRLQDQYEILEAATNNELKKEDQSSVVLKSSWYQ